MFLYSHFPNDVRPRKESKILSSKGHKLRIFCLRAPGEKRTEMYSKNISTLLQHLTKDGDLNLDFDDQITNEACVTHNGDIRHERVKETLA